MTAELILGTAGHIDHGKTALVRALTGVDCDRLPEEKARGITIALGFAPLVLPSGRRLGVVDVPGHEKLVRTMVAGATGIDLVLLVVAADEGVMPQTREHLAICNLLGIERGVLALTKIDAAPSDLADVTRLEVEEELLGTSLAGIPCIPVSALRGDGLDDLRAALDRAAAEATPKEIAGAPAWLPVDRVFTKHGFGTVVTGTLRGSALHEGQQVEIWPEGGRAPLLARLRGLQVHGAPSDVVPPGSRCAANLQGVEVAQVPRGSVVATPGRVGYRSRVEVELHVLPSAPPLETNKTFTVHVGTSERLARIQLIGTPAIAPGESGFAEVRLREPVVALQGDRFVLRGFARIPSAGWTVGGGLILDAAPSPLRHRVSARHAYLTLQSAAFARDAPKPARRDALAARLARAGLRGISRDELRRDTLTTEALEGVRVGNDLWIAPEHFQTLVERSAAAVAEHHRAHPEDAMVGLAQVTSQLGGSATDLAVRTALDRAVAKGALEAAEGGYRTPGHRAHMADAELGAAVLEQIRDAGLAPDGLDALAIRNGVTKAELRPIVDHLVRAGELTRVTADLFFARHAIDELRVRLVAYLEEKREIDPTSYKNLTGQTRKFTVPLMEFFDAERLTVRSGNVRTLRQRG